MKLFKNFIREEEGQDAVEYALLLGFVSIGIVAAATTLGANVTGIFTNAGTAIAGAPGA